MDNWKKNLWVCLFGVFIVSSGTSQIAPILPLYIDHLGIHDPAAIARWSGLVFACNFVTLAIFSPIWGNFSDKYGRKPMILRASLGLALFMTCMGFVQNVYQLAGLRLLSGALSGYQSAVITLIATQTPKDRSGWALGMIFSGQVGGLLLGPLLGGFMAEVLGFRGNFITIGLLCLIAFGASLLFVNEPKVTVAKNAVGFREIWRALPNKQVTLCLFATTLVLQMGLMSVQPIITVYVAHLSAGLTHIALVAGAVFAASGLASVLFAPQLGKLSDKIGPHKVLLASLVAAGLLYVPQAFVTSPWQLGLLLFLVGTVTAGLLPSVNNLIKRSTPAFIAGRVYGYNQSAQFTGVFLGAILGGQVAGAFGVRCVFFSTGTLLLLNAAWVYRMVYRQPIFNQPVNKA